MVHGRGMTTNEGTHPGSADAHPAPSRCRDCWIASMCLPAQLLPGDVERLETLIRPCGPLRPGQRLTSPASDARQLFVVLSGCLRTAVTTEDGQSHVVDFHLHSDVLSLEPGSMEARDLEIVALERTAGCMVSVDALHRLNPQPAGLQERIEQMMHREVTACREHIVMMGCVSAQQRVALFLQAWSRRMRAAGFSDTDLQMPMTRADLASYLGITPETVSRAISRLQADGAVVLGRHRIEIRDARRLASFSGSDIRAAAPAA